jgi:assimilatory nitrate reductase catalytic subunit
MHVDNGACARPSNVLDMRTHCPYCALQCGMRVETAADGSHAVSGDETFDVNAGALCTKGFTAAETLAHPDRILTPLVRRDGVLRPASWDEALDEIAARFGELGERHGRDAIAVFGSGALTNERAYALGKFARLALRTRNFDYNGRFCMSSAAVAANRAFGLDRGLPFPLEWLDRTACLLVAGGNPGDTMPPLARRLDARRTGSTIVVDPRRTAFAAGATQHLAVMPGTDAFLARALLHVVLAEGFADTAYVAARTRGFDDVRRQAERADPERAERFTGVAADDIRTAARRLATAESAIVLTARGVEQHRDGSDAANAYVNLALALGLPGKALSGYGTITGQANGQGSREHGQKSDQLPGYRSARDPNDRAAVAAAWGVADDDLGTPGLTAAEILIELGKSIRGIFIVGSNPAVSAPNAAAVRAGLARADCVVVCDFFPSETTTYAHVVLPTLQWAEESGTVTNLEGRLLLRERVAEPPAGPRSDLRVLADLAARLGAPHALETSDPAKMFDELARVTRGGRADYSAASHARIRAGETLYWPVSDAAPRGTPVLFETSFPTPDGRARFVAADETAEPSETPDATYPYAFVTGRVRDHYLSGTQTRRVRRLVRSQPEPFVEMHVTVAAHLGVTEGQLVRVRSRRGSVDLRARISAEIRPDTLFSAFHWAEPGAANDVTSDALDPHSRMPAFKGCAVSLERVLQT